MSLRKGVNYGLRFLLPNLGLPVFIVVEVFAALRAKAFSITGFLLGAALGAVIVCAGCVLLGIIICRLDPNFRVFGYPDER